mmetsp:Transcript_2137/g.6178  ORF Transcript_2137/g.6178 Transcript_2137/m.6178 type:complete len:501 (+) Transcript_2137:593-2095(+)
MTRETQDAPTQALVHGLRAAAKDEARSWRRRPRHLFRWRTTKVGQYSISLRWFLIAGKALVKCHEGRVPNRLHQRLARLACHVLTVFRLRCREEEIRRRVDGRRYRKLGGSVPLALEAVGEGPILVSLAIPAASTASGGFIHRCHGGYQRRPLNVIGIAHSEEDHGLLSTIEGSIHLLGMLPLDVPLPSDGGAGQIQLRRRPNDEEDGVLRLQDRTWLAASGRPTGVVIDGGIGGVTEHVVGNLAVLPGAAGLRVLVLPGELAQFGLSVGKVTAITKGTLTLQKVLTERDLEEFIRLGRRTAGHLPILPGLHLAQPQGEVGDLRSLDAILPHVLVAAERSVDAKALTVKHTLEPIGLGYVPEGTVLHLALVAVTTKGHFGQVILVEEFARRALHTKVAQPMATHDSSESRIVLGGRHNGLGIISGGEDGASLAVGQRVDGFWNTLCQGKVLKIIFHLIDCEGLGRKDRVVGGHRCVVIHFLCLPTLGSSGGSSRGPKFVV